MPTIFCKDYDEYCRKTPNPMLEMDRVESKNTSEENTQTDVPNIESNDSQEDALPF